MREPPSAPPAISRGVVEAHGGSLEATAAGPGAEFTLTLPRGTEA